MLALCVVYIRCANNFPLFFYDPIQITFRLSWHRKSVPFKNNRDDLQSFERESTERTLYLTKKHSKSNSKDLKIKEILIWKFEAKTIDRKIYPETIE